MEINGNPWVKTDTGLHDITMGGLAGAELCELVGLYLLYKLKEKGLNSGLYRGDGLLLSRKSAQTNERDKKLIANANLKQVIS